MMRRNHWLTGLAAAAALPAVPRAARANDLIRIAGVPFDVTALPYFGAGNGIFKKYGIDLEFDTFSSNGSAIASAVSGGSMDVGVSNIPTLALAHLKRFPYTIVAGGGLYQSSAPINALVVLNASPLRTAKDLEGKTLGTNGLNNIGQFGPQAWIDKNGGDSAKVKFIEVPPAEMAAALSQGRIDAAFVTEPFLTADKSVARVFATCFDAVASRFLICAFFTTTDWADAHPELLRRFQSAMRESAHWSNANHAATADVLAGLSKVDPKLLHAINRAAFPETLDAGMLQPVVDVTTRYAGVDHVRAEELIYRGGATRG
jgi:NitT/TauT family transport system substrate-binding protein